MFTKIRTFFQLQKSILWEYGWLKSWWHNKPIDNNKDPIPWITYPAIDFLKQFNYSESLVFEWGSGYSTLWWAKRCKEITSVESYSKWYELLKPKLPSNVVYLTCAIQVDEEMKFFLESDSTYDVIIVDHFGPFRKHCCEIAPQKLNPGGIILLDNSDQCLLACEVLRNKGFQQIDFSGLAPSCSYAQTTSIFFKEHIKFSTINNFQPLKSLAQPNGPWENC
jgi:hypothetical protein